MKRTLFSLIVCLLIVAGCASKRNIKPPHPLVDVDNSIHVQKLWTSKVGKAGDETSLRFRPTLADGVIYTATPDGILAALNAKDGKTIWKQKRKKKQGDGSYAGGPSVAGDLLVVGTLDGHLYGFDSQSGEQIWDSTTSAGVLAKPVIVDNQVFVRTNDGKITSVDANNGETQWVYDQSEVPLLSLRGNGSLLVTNGVVFFGSDDGKLVALRSDTGDKLWEQQMADAIGHTEVDRLGDADGAVLIDNDTLYAAAYQGHILAVDGPSAQVLWSQPFSTYGSMAVANNLLVAANDKSEIWAFDTLSGSNVWKQDKLSWRWVSGPAFQQGYILVGDMQGYLHWLSADDGHFVARTRMSKKAINAQPLVVDGVAYVEDQSGQISAFAIDTDIQP